MIDGYHLESGTDDGPGAGLPGSAVVLADLEVRTVRMAKSNFWGAASSTKMEVSTFQDR